MEVEVGSESLIDKEVELGVEPDVATDGNVEIVTGEEGIASFLWLHPSTSSLHQTAS